MANRRFGFRSGKVHARNIQTGRQTVSLNSAGDGSQAVTFKHLFNATPSICLTPEDTSAITTGLFQVSSSDASGFTIHVDGSSTTDNDIIMNWIAIRQTD